MNRPGYHQVIDPISYDFNGSELPNPDAGCPADSSRLAGAELNVLSLETSVAEATLIPKATEISRSPCLCTRRMIFYMRLRMKNDLQISPSVHRTS
jgi:hypothetical protein